MRRSLRTIAIMSGIVLHLGAVGCNHGSGGLAVFPFGKKTGNCTGGSCGEGSCGDGSCHAASTGPNDRVVGPAEYFESLQNSGVQNVSATRPSGKKNVTGPNSLFAKYQQ